MYVCIEHIFIVPEEGSSRFLQNASTHLPYCMVSNMRTPLIVEVFYYILMLCLISEYREELDV
jgi:hypothetical protein